MKSDWDESVWLPTEVGRWCLTTPLRAHWISGNDKCERYRHQHIFFWVVSLLRHLRIDTKIDVKRREDIFGKGSARTGKKSNEDLNKKRTKKTKKKKKWQTGNPARLCLGNGILFILLSHSIIENLSSTDRWRKFIARAIKYSFKSSLSWRCQE